MLWRKFGSLVVIVFLVLYASPAFTDHSQYIKGPFADGVSVTKECFKCHQDKAEEILDSAHWLWRGPTPYVVGAEKRNDLGKINLINGF